MMIESMRFSEKWVLMIMKCVSSISYFVSVNGRMWEFFKPTRGLRQGNPLSPFLFLIRSQGLSNLMRLAVKDGLLKSARASHYGPKFHTYYLLMIVFSLVKPLWRVLMS